MKIMEVKRVPYGRADTPEELREYRLEQNSVSAVGTKTDWLNYAEMFGYDEVKFIEKEVTICVKI